MQEKGEGGAGGRCSSGWRECKWIEKNVAEGKKELMQRAVHQFSKQTA